MRYLPTVLCVPLGALLAAGADSRAISGREGAGALNIFSWNVHWQCGSDHIPGCRAVAVDNFLSLTASTGADVAIAIEIESSSCETIDFLALPAASEVLNGWSQVVVHPCLFHPTRA
jgi:hypothetical protein